MRDIKNKLTPSRKPGFGASSGRGMVNGVGPLMTGAGSVSAGSVGGSYSPGSVRSHYAPGSVRSHYAPGNVRSNYQANEINYDSSYKPERFTKETEYKPKDFDFDYKSSPGYQFQRDENMRAITNRKAQRGLGSSGEEWAALQERSQDLAAQDYGNQWARGFQTEQYHDNQARYLDDIGWNRAFQTSQYHDNQDRFYDTNLFNQAATKFNAAENSRQFAANFGQRGDQMNEGNRQFAANFGQRGDQMNEGNRQFAASFGQRGDQMNEGNRQFAASFGQRAEMANASNSLQAQGMNWNQNFQQQQFNQGLNNTKWDRLNAMANMGYGATQNLTSGVYNSASALGTYGTGTPYYATPQGSVVGAGIQGGTGAYVGMNR